MYTLKSIVRRASAMGSAVALLAATVLPSVPVYADALNPLTERSLTLSSGSPGWAFTDGSGNSTYAPPNSGANGNKTGNTFSFRVSSDASVLGLSFQYCTTSAGYCKGPGNNTTSGSSPAMTRAANGTTEYDLSHSDLEVVTATPTEVSSANYAALFNDVTGQPSSAANVPNADNSEGNFIVLHKAPGDPDWTQSEGWTMTASGVQDCAEGTNATCVGVGKATGKNNYITLTDDTGVDLDAGDYVKIIFFGTDTNYIINPGADAFFVKINTYSSDTSLIGSHNDATPADDSDHTVIDGGVTVANVMNESIQITTKVLETMDFSVGTVDPYTLEAKETMDGSSQLFLANGNERHGPCDPILKGMTPTSPVNTLQLGSETGEFSLETDDTFSTHSYWRLSSNSSAGATVYYSGVTLSNTVNDKIDAIGATKAAPIVGSEQFGLALANGDTASGDPHAVAYTVERGHGSENFENGADNLAAGIVAGTGVHASVEDDDISNLDVNASYHAPRLMTMDPTANYDDGAGVVNANYAAPSTPIDTAFAFDENSNLVPVALATETNDVINCVTGKVRYIANIAATTPAGIYTTKINYIAAPQY